MEPWKARNQDMARIDELLRTTIPLLTHDPRNAERLSNAAVALFAFEVSWLHGVDERAPAGQSPSAGSARFHHAAVHLLSEADRAFPENRAVLLNLAFLSSLRSQWSNEKATQALSLSEAVGPASRWLAGHPDDVTARFLLGSLVARQSEGLAGLDAAIGVLSPLLDDAKSRPLGYAALGDARLALALRWRDASPFAARDLVRQALADYDRALNEANDPGILTGRAAALDFLGEHGAAVAAQERAVALAPRASELRRSLALLQQRAGDLDGFRDNVSILLDQVLPVWDPPLGNLRFTVADSNLDEALGPGYLGFSFGTDRDLVVVYQTPWQAGAGSYVVALDLFPQPPELLHDGRQESLMPAAAFEFAVDAAVASGDATAATLLVERRQELSGRNAWRIDSLLGANMGSDPYTVGADAAHAVADFRFAQHADRAGLRLAVGVLERSGRYAEASRICRVLEDLHCAGINAYIADDPAAAAALLAAYDRAQTTSGADDPGVALIRLRAGQAAMTFGDLESAKRLFTIASVSGPEAYRAVGFAKLGEIDLDAGHPAAALPKLERALADLWPGEDSLADPATAPSLGARVAVQVVENNRGIARLWSARSSETDPPNCAARRELCSGARADFEAALAIDPANPVYLLNLGWTERLLGDVQAARLHLTKASEVDPSLYPTHNDLGVLAAQDGNLDEARRSFEAALAGSPEYDLALWNLGVIELQNGMSGVAQSQAYFARAIEINPSFRDDEPRLKTDERIYRVAFEPRDFGAWAFGQSASVAASLLGSVGLVAAILNAVKSIGSDKGVEKLARYLELLLKRQNPLSRGLEPAVVTAASRALRMPLSLLGRGVLTAPLLALRHRLAPSLEPDVQGMPGLPTGRHARRWIPWLTTIFVLFGVTIWPVWRGEPQVRIALAVIAVVAIGLAVLTHELGHVVAARLVHARIDYVHWVPGMMLAVLLLPLQLSVGPYMCQRVEAKSEEDAWWAYLGGPLANLAVAAAAYAMFLVQPMPILRLIAGVQLAAVAFVLLPFVPLDGPALERRWPGLLGAMTFVVTATGILLAIGIL
jgi:tetratricopeptide (TPR) repeat protein/Zn-dependent protease